jgi:hypothetical protein
MGFPTMRVQYPYDSSSPRAFLKAHHVLAAFVAAALVTAAVGVSAGAWQLSKGSDESASATRNTSGFDRIEYMAGGGSPSIRIATVDELIAANEAALEPHFGAAPCRLEVVVPSASTDEPRDPRGADRRPVRGGTNLSLQRWPDLSAVA